MLKEIPELDFENKKIKNKGKVDEEMEVDLNALRKHYHETSGEEQGEVEFQDFIDKFGVSLSAKIISSIKQVDNHTRLYVQNEGLSTTKEYTSYLYNRPTLTARANSKNKDIHLPDLMSAMYSEMQTAIKVRSQMVPVFKMRRLLGNNEVKFQMNKTLGDDFHRDMTNQLKVVEGLRTLDASAVDRLADWVLGRLGTYGLGSVFTMMKMQSSYPLAAMHMWNPFLMSNPKLSLFSGESEESKNWRKDSLFNHHRYDWNFRGDVALGEAHERGIMRRVFGGPKNWTEISADIISLADKRATKMIWRMAWADVEHSFPDLVGEEKRKAVERKGGATMTESGWLILELMRTSNSMMRMICRLQRSCARKWVDSGYPIH